MYETKGLYKGSGGCLFNGRGKVIGEFVCETIVKAIKGEYGIYLKYGKTQINVYDLLDYATNKNGELIPLYGWHISNLKIYEKPKELFDFANYDKYQVCKERNCFSDNCWICPNNAIVIRSPQSYMFVESLGE